MKQPVSTPRSSALLVFCLLLSCTLAEAATGSAITDDVVVNTVSVGPPVLDLDSFYESNSGQAVSVDATPIEGGPTNFAYQWYFNGFAIPSFVGGTVSAFSVDGSVESEGTWRVVVTNSEGSAEASFEYRVFVDSDGDGLSDYRESNITNTDPDLADTDSDGLNDSAELNTHSTDPNDSDSDDDGLSDGAEVNTHSTDPKVSDSDADGLSDGAEVNTHSTDPKVSDSDGDGLSDGAEVTTHGTNPNASDSDADGLSDADEITTHSTDPNLADSDSDGLVDGVEINTHSSDPLASDSSGDGLSDGYVVSVGFDPNTNYTGILEGSEGMTQDLRIGAEIASVANGAATLQIVLEESADLSNWSHRETVDLVVPLQAGETTKFFRYAMQGAASDDGEAPAVPADFALIPGGSFQMGDALDGRSDAPVVTVNVSEFYMSIYEVTKAEWDEVRTWGLSNGYTDLPTGGGKAANHPVHSINWYAMVKWCNARSEKEGRTPCYTVSGSIYRTGSSDAVECDWTATGYRLPTEAEWEKAARGGLTGQRFPWGATISHANANYYESTYYSYDVGDGSGTHPDYDSGDTPYTSAVGSFAANGYGLYDMAGNVFEWCWDWKSSSYSDGAADPRGASSGSDRVRRGGSWDGSAGGCRVAGRSGYIPSHSDDSYGFRVALSSVPQ